MSKIHKRRNHTTAFKKEVVPEFFKGEKSIQQIAAEYGIWPAPGQQAESSGVQVAR